jgi:hypothetical protein
MKGTAFAIRERYMEASPDTLHLFLSIIWGPRSEFSARYLPWSFVLIMTE